MTRAKICGITNLADAQWAVEQGASALGFIWVPDTPRFVPSHPEGEQVSLKVSPFVSRVAVCRTVNEAPPTLGTEYDTLQYYTATAQLREWVGRVRLVQAFRVRDRESVESMLREIEEFRPSAVLLDAYHEKHLGGAGVTFDWSLAVFAKERLEIPLILAGGLTPENVEQAIHQVQPYAVDVSSGVEATPGRKCPEKVCAFLRAVQSANGNAGNSASSVASNV
jgi:phosphoribosylanthranilate isomerase